MRHVALGDHSGEVNGRECLVAHSQRTVILYALHQAFFALRFPVRFVAGVMVSICPGSSSCTVAVCAQTSMPPIIKPTSEPNAGVNGQLCKLQFRVSSLFLASVVPAMVCPSPTG